MGKRDKRRRRQKKLDRHEANMKVGKTVTVDIGEHDAQKVKQALKQAPQKND